MPTESSIVLITNNEEVAQILKPKLILLREIDNILPIKYEDAISQIKEASPKVVLLHSSDENAKCLELIRQIKTDEETKDCAVLLIVDHYDQDFILSAYDENISDYFTLSADDAEILMRIIWCIKKSDLIAKLKKQHHFLEELGVIDKKTGFYTQEYSDKILKTEFEHLKKLELEGTLLLISASEDSKTKLDPLVLAKAIRKSTRESDVIIHEKANRFYVLLNKTNLKGSFTVLEKIKRNVGEIFTLTAGVTGIGDKDSEQVKKELLNAITEAISTKQDLVIANEEEKNLAGGNWLDKINSNQKNFKLFKQAFNKKLEKVITPVFFQIQKKYEEKLFETQIEQSSNATLSSFVLKKDERTSELKITYPGFSKINIDMLHQGFDSPENKRISLDLTELDEKKLTDILEKFIVEFKKG